MIFQPQPDSSPNLHHGDRPNGGTAIAAGVLALLGAAHRLLSAVLAVGLYMFLDTGSELLREADRPMRTTMLISAPIFLVIGALLLLGGIQLLRRSRLGRAFVVAACVADIAYGIIEFAIVKAVAASNDDLISIGSPVLVTVGVIFPVITIGLTVSTATTRWLDCDDSRNSASLQTALEQNQSRVSPSATPGAVRGPLRAVRPIDALGHWSIGLIGCTTAALLVFVNTEAMGHRALDRYHGEYPNIQARTEFHDWSMIVGPAVIIMFVALLGTGIVFLVWLRQARSNADALCAARHRLPIGWVVGGWFCPVVNLWFPATILTDVLRASDPRTPKDAPDLRGRPGGLLVGVWWSAWLATWTVLFWPVDSDFLSPVRAAVVALLMVVAGACAAVIITRIGNWQRSEALAGGSSDSRDRSCSPR
ncbi:DUF4328 domain-containing protein [Nocardia sp. NPDC050408]|uniref:DUF4328 domain-containing protein n=1 Tax=Nocardia sp. NPDC050408 TaxID=3364319 RepID=UPI003788C5DD